VALDPIISLAFSLADAPGSCVCFLGAGVSVDAGVPTSWGILQDGLFRLYRQETRRDSTPTENELDGWLKEKGFGHLGYSSLLDLIAPDPAVRREMLAGYFIDVEPGPAHELLADLAAARIIRVFVTTNFDRLLEQALRARGLEPVVVSDDATLAAAPKREHSPVFIVKAHGDYMQETIRNTPSELAELDPRLAEELARIVDNYGVLVIGWSGRDPALAEILRNRNSRYGVWWLSIINPPEDDTAALIESTGARTIVRAGAGEFLAELRRRVEVHEQYETGDDPGTVHDETLALLKRNDPVELTEMLRRERYAFESASEAVRTEYANQQSSEAIREGWEKLSSATDRRLASLIPLAIHRLPVFDEEIRAMTAWASSVKPRSGLSAWIDIWRLPFFVIGMAIGALAVRLERYPALTSLFVASWTDPNGYRTRFVAAPGDLGRVVAANLGPKAPNGKWIFPEWQWLITEFPKKDWLANRYPEWLRRDGEPWQSFIEFSLLLDIASGVLAENGRIAWWSLDPAAAAAFAQRLQRDTLMRSRIANAVSLDLQAFDEKAPELLESSHGIGMFPDIGRVVNALRTGNPW
jgi:hypothetical protein